MFHISESDEAGVRFNFGTYQIIVMRPKDYSVPLPQFFLPFFVIESDKKAIGKETNMGADI